MNKGDRVTTPRGQGVIVRFHYEPVSLGTRNIRRIAWVLIRYDDGTTQFVPPRHINQEGTMTTIEPQPTPEPDPTPPQPEPVEGDDDEKQLIEWP